MELADGRYKLEKVIGQGGFATVWRGYDSALGVHRAVKLLHPNLSARAQFRERLRAEARAMARLAHPNVLTVHDIGVQDGQDWFVMDLVEGGSLGDWQQRGGPLPPDLAVACAIQVLSALSAAHAAGIVHRDVKPQNILLDTDGRCRLADFGIALLESEELLRSTKTGATMGSLSFMAPEQRLSAKGVGPGADLYAVGSTLYSLLTDANAIDLFIAGPDSARWDGVPQALRAVVQKVTQHEPSQRYHSAAEMAEALAAARRELPADDWDSWIHQVSAARATGGPTLVLPTMDVMQRSTKHALTIFEPADGPMSPPTAVPATQGAEATYFEPPPSDDEVATPTAVESGGTASFAWTGDTVPPPVPPPPSRVRWLAPMAALLIGGVGLWTWAPWQAAEPVTGGQAPPPDAPGSGVEPEPEPVAAVEPPPSEDAVVDVQPVQSREPAGSRDPQPTLQPDEVSDPQPTLQPEPDPAASSSAVAGRWAGSYNGKDVTLELSGSDQALQGSLVVTFFGNEQASRVRGSFDEGRLVLEDQDRSDRYAAKHVGTLGADGRIEGQSTTFSDGRIISFTFWR